VRKKKIKTIFIVMGIAESLVSCHYSGQDTYSDKTLKLTDASVCLCTCQSASGATLVSKKDSCMGSATSAKDDRQKISTALSQEACLAYSKQGRTCIGYALPTKTSSDCNEVRGHFTACEFVQNKKQ